MHEPETAADRDLETLCRSLGLEYERQDWGIINGNGNRLGEFISYYNETPSLSPTQKFELGGLILASANERLRDTGAVGEELRPFVAVHGAEFRAQLDYWRSLEDPDEWPLGRWLRAQSSDLDGER